MKTHELAQRLIDLPDLTVLIADAEGLNPRRMGDVETAFAVKERINGEECIEIADLNGRRPNVILLLEASHERCAEAVGQQVRERLAEEENKR